MRQSHKHIFSILSAFFVTLLSVSPTYGQSEEVKVTEIAIVIDDIMVEADSTAADYFVSAPLSVIPTIDKMTRMDMIDYFRAGSDRASKNRFGGDCRILEDSHEKIVISTSDASEYTIALLPADGRKLDRMIMVIRTLKAPAEDSSISFYDSDWKEVSNVFTLPLLEDWMLPQAKKKNRKDIENAIPFIMAKCVYSPDDYTMTFTTNLTDYIPEEALELAKQSIKKSIVYHWNGKRMILKK